MNASIRHLRVGAQRIHEPIESSPAALVGAFGAVQAQDYASALWAVGLRLPSTSQAKVDAALARGQLIRTHAFRGTWQLIAAKDVRWIVALAAPRVLAKAARRYEQLGLDGPTLSRAHRALTSALEDGTHRTRAQLADALRRARIDPSAQRLSHILIHAELSGLICSGINDGKQTTHALLDQRVPVSGQRFDRDQALKELAIRYFSTRGPAGIDDFVWWSGLTTSDARAGVEAAGARLVSERRGQRVLWRASRAASPVEGKTALTPAFDELIVAYRQRQDLVDPRYAKRINAGGGMLSPCVVSNGQVLGLWKRFVTPDQVRIELTYFSKKLTADRSALTAAAERYAAFVGREPKLVLR